MNQQQMIDRVFSQITQQGVVPTTDSRGSVHFGVDDMPWVYASEGSEKQLFHVDLNQGLWISKTRFQPNTVSPRHFHTGCVFVVTLKGSWYYEEQPDAVNGPGSYLFEPAGAVHTLVVPQQEDVTEVWFAIWGANILMDELGNATSIWDAKSYLEIYRAFCRELGASTDALMVVGE